jgi:hypothetical protein
MKYLIFLMMAASVIAADFTIVTPYDSTDIWNLQYAQYDNKMYLCNPDDPPHLLQRQGHNAWTITDLSTGTYIDASDVSQTDPNLQINDGPFMEDVDDATTITASATTGSVTLNASEEIWDEDHVGALWQISHQRPSVALTGTFTGNGTSSNSEFFTGQFSFVTNGAWRGTVSLERSEDASDWEPYFTPLTNTNFANFEEREDDGAYYRVVMTGWAAIPDGYENSPGNCDYTFTILSQIVDGVVQISAFTDPNTVTATVISPLQKTTATKRWREGYWSDYRGWPRTVAHHQQRLVFGGSESFPQAIWFGKLDPASPYSFEEGVDATDAITAVLNGQNTISWLKTGDYLFVGTTATVGKYGEKGEGISPTSANYTEQSNAGCNFLQPELAGDTLIYVERGDEKVRALSYELTSDKYNSGDLTMLAEDINDTGIKQIAYQQRPYSILWCVLDDGTVSSMLYQPEQDVVAWSKHTTDGLFESVAVIPGEADSSNEEEDEVWFVVKRVVDGNDVRYIEKMMPFDWEPDYEDAWFVDSGLDYDSSPVTDFNGLEHLIGETVQVYADANILGDEVVDPNGAITIDWPASRVIVGLPYTAKMETMPISVDPQDKPYQKKVLNVWLDYYLTGDLKYAMGDSGTVTPVNFGGTLKTSHEALDKYRFIYGTMGKPTIYIESDEPVPLTVRSIVPEVAAYGQD